MVADRTRPAGLTRIARILDNQTVRRTLIGCGIALLVFVGGLVVAVAVIGGDGDSSATTTTAFDGYGFGTHLVGVDIQPGVYETAGPQPGSSCWWERHTENDTLIARGEIFGPARLTVRSADYAVEFTGFCKWRPAN
jgi:hypothetical protein